MTAAAVADARKVATAAHSPSTVRASLFAATPLLISDYGDGAAALALDWYESLREAAQVQRAFTPRPVNVIDDEKLMSTVAWATQALHDLEQEMHASLQANADQLLAQATDEAMTRLLPEIQKQVAAGFRDTVTRNTAEDPASVGWRRFARADGCPFCRMLASRGAVYTEASVDFAAHTDCHCVVGPAYDPNAPRADVMQYVASSKNRTPEQQAALRDYLNANYPDAPG